MEIITFLNIVALIVISLVFSSQRKRLRRLEKATTMMIKEETNIKATLKASEKIHSLVLKHLKLRITRTPEKMELKEIPTFSPASIMGLAGAAVQTGQALAEEKKPSKKTKGKK